MPEAQRPLRADARRNQDRILAAAGAAIAQHGAEASLEQIARRAGVGSATLHRHFPSRQALLEAVFRARVESLCARAHELAIAHEPGAALTGWLHAVGAHAAGNRGLATALVQGGRDGDPTFGETCHSLIAEVGQQLLDRARTCGAVRPGITVVQLLRLVSAISLATEQDADGPAEAAALITLALEGVRPGPVQP